MLSSIVGGQRLANIQAAARDVQVRMRDCLRSGLFRMAGNVMESTDTLRRRLIDNQAPGLASMLASLPPMQQQQQFWKCQFVSAVSRIYMLCSAILNFESLSPEWQDEVLMLSGVAMPQSLALQSEPAADRWMCLALVRQPFNSITMVKTWLAGQKSRRLAYILDYQTAGSHIKQNFAPGRCYDAPLHFYPGIHSMRAIHGQVSQAGQIFAPSAVNGLDPAFRICRRAFADNPFMLEIPLIVSGLRLAQDSGCLALADDSKNIFPIDASFSQKQKIMCCTGGRQFAAFAVFREFCCQILSIWADGLFYVIEDERD